MKQERKLPLRIAAALLVLSVLYVVASGPLYRLAAVTATTGGSFWKCIDAVYQPLLQAATATGYDQPMLKYLRWWGLHTRRAVLEVGRDRSGPQTRVIRIGVLPPVSSVALSPSHSTTTPTPGSKPPANAP